MKNRFEVCIILHAMLNASLNNKKCRLNKFKKMIAEKFNLRPEHLSSYLLPVLRPAGLLFYSFHSVCGLPYWIILDYLSPVQETHC